MAFVSLIRYFHDKNHCFQQAFFANCKLQKTESMISLDTSIPVWDQFFMIAPLIVIGSKEGDGYDLAPKHMAMALGKANYFGFMCTPRHSTYHNIKRHRFFTVSFPRPNQISLASLAASPRCGDERNPNHKPILGHLPIIMAKHIDAPFMEDAYVFFECSLDRIVDGFDQHSLIAGTIEHAYVSEDSLRSFEKEDQDMIYQSPMLAYLANGRFSAVKDTLAFPFPKDFQL